MTFCWVGNKKNYIYILMGNKKKKKKNILPRINIKKKKKTHIDVKKGKIKRGPGQQAQHT